MTSLCIPDIIIPAENDPYLLRARGINLVLLLIRSLSGYESRLLEFIRECEKKNGCYLPSCDRTIILMTCDFINEYVERYRLTKEIINQYSGLTSQILKQDLDDAILDVDAKYFIQEKCELCYTNQHHHLFQNDRVENISWRWQ